MAEISNEDMVRWEGLIERLTAMAHETKNAASTALDVFLTRQDADDWLAIALFELGDVSVVPDLVDAVNHDQDIFMLAANKLASKSVREAGPAILKRLESSLNGDEVVLATLLRALWRVSDELPQKTNDSLKEIKSERVRDALSYFRRG